MFEGYRCFISFILLIVVLGIRAWMRRRVVRKIKELPSKQKQTMCNQILQPYGLSYEDQDDTLQSIMYPWQRMFGYCALYDQCAAKLNMVLECEPIYFTYDTKQWMIELWKGQYAFATGGEIGIYVMEQEEIEIPGIFKGPFYRCAHDEERIYMKFILLHGDKEVMRREGLHWWLTGFSIGSYVPAQELVMQVELSFPNSLMRDAFMQAIIENGYGKDGVGVNGNTVVFCFTRPKSKQPTRGKAVTALRQKKNQWVCWWYRHLTRDFVSTLDKTLFLKEYYPILNTILFYTLKKIKIEKIVRRSYEQIKSGLKQ